MNPDTYPAEHMSETMWIASNRTDETIWHLGRKREQRGARTGRLMHTYYVTACSGRQLGGAWGQATQLIT